MKFISCLTTCYVIIGLILIKLIDSYAINSRKDWDICSHWNGRRHFLELGERGELHARNVSSSNYRSAFYTSPLVNIDNTTILSENWYQCNLELVTCSECVIRITFTYWNFSKECQQPLNNKGNTLLNRCPCERITFSEPPYEAAISGQSFCGNEKMFRSKTRTVLFKFYFRATNSHVFSLQYFSERNVNVISGSPKADSEINKSSEIFTISTPYFPIPYPRDYGIEHILTCESENCHIKLEFTDFQLGIMSSLMIFDSNGQMLDSYNGDIFRPPIILSTGKSLLIQFRGNGVTALGYRAEISFISESEYKDKLNLPNTDCGGMVESLGGAITMMNMIENETENKYYDCIWIIKPANNYMMMKTHISLRVDTFIGMESTSIVEIRQGLISTATLVESLKWPSSKSEKTHVTQILTGFYIRLKGVFGKKTRLAIVYSVFNYMNCYIGSEFLCQNNHCLSIRLHCDGFDHCGDNSDEAESCEQQRSNAHSEQHEWYSSKPNYYFPKIEQYPDLKTATGIFVMSTLGILVVLSGWMMILYRMGVRARHQRELQSQLQTISELLDRDRQDEPPDNPPDYEAPPDYEEVVKFGIGNEVLQKKNIQRNKKRLKRINKDPRIQELRQGNVENNILHSRENSRKIDNLNARPERLQLIANQIVNSSAICETSNPSTSWKKSEINTANNDIPTTLSNKESKRENNLTSAYSSGTSTQFEENSSEFQDDSLNISFSLAGPKSKLKFEQTKRDVTSKENLNCLGVGGKKAWVVFDNGQIQTLQNKRIRLRHTYSSPETFLRQIIDSDDMNYGNIYSERESFLSNTSTFGSDLSSDSVIKNPTNASNNNLTKDDNIQFSNKTTLKLENEISPTMKTSNDDFDISFSTTSNLKNMHVNTDYEKFYFDTVTLFNNNKREINRLKSKKSSNKRSNSFTNCERRCEINEDGLLKRYSSADLLIRTYSPFKFRTSSPPI